MRVDVRISELDEAQLGPRPNQFPGPAISLPHFHEHAVPPVAELAATPVDTAAELLGWFFAAILPHGPDLRGRLGIV